MDPNISGCFISIHFQLFLIYLYFVFGAFKTVRSKVSETIHNFSIDRVCRFENALPSQMYRKFATMQGDLAFFKNSEYIHLLSDTFAIFQNCKVVSYKFL